MDDTQMISAITGNPVFTVQVNNNTLYLKSAVTGKTDYIIPNFSPGGGGDVTRQEFNALALRVTNAEGTITVQGAAIDDHETRITALESAVAPDSLLLRQQMIFFHASGWQTFTEDMLCGNWDVEGFPVNWVFGEYGDSGLFLKFN